MNRFYNAHTLWLLMLALTLATYAVGQLAYTGPAAMLFLLLTALIKSTVIIRDFMGLRGVSLLWRVIMYGWLWTVILAIGITYLVSL